MARILWACWDGGGNLTPSIGITRVLEARGHDVAFVGRPDMVGRVEAAGIEAMALVHARTDLEQWKVGRALPGDAGSTQIRAAAEDVLGNPIFRDEAARRALAFSGIDGAERAASSIERVMPGAVGA